MAKPTDIYCPCCGYNTLSERAGYEICTICWWEDDGQDNEQAGQVWGGPNSDLSLTEARKNFLLHGLSNPKRKDLFRRRAERRFHDQGRFFDITAEGKIEELIRDSDGSEPFRYTILYRPIGQKEKELIEQSGFAAFPPRLPEQPIFYPVLNEEYATQIARDWNTKDPASGYVGYVTRFNVRTSYLSQYEVQTVGSAAIHQEYWIPSESLNEFNSNIIGGIEIISSFASAGSGWSRNLRGEDR